MPIPDRKEDKLRASAKEVVYETIKKWIIEGTLRPGEKLLDGEMADYFSVSRTPVREAFQLLEEQKLIKSFPGKATIVTEIETENIDQWYKPLIALQRLAVNMATEKGTQSNFAELKAINIRFQQEAERKDISGITDLDKEFHDYIIKIAGNSYIMSFCDTLMSHVLRLEFMFFKKNIDISESVSEHEKLISAMERKDEFTADLIIQQHWNRTVIQIRNIIQSSTGI